MEKCQNFVNHWISQICEEFKAEHLLAFKISGEIGVVGSNPTRVVGSCVNSYFENSGIGATSDFGVESFKLSVREVSKISEPLDQWRLTVVDPMKGEFFKFRES